MKKPVSMIPVCISLRVAAANVHSSNFEHEVAHLEAMGNIQDTVERMKAALTACVAGHDQRSKDLGLRIDDPQHILEARQLLANLG
jgi:hypothetical protein